MSPSASLAVYFSSKSWSQAGALIKKLVGENWLEQVGGGTGDFSARMGEKLALLVGPGDGKGILRSHNETIGIHRKAIGNHRKAIGNHRKALS